MRRRRAYEKAVVWVTAAESQNLPQANIEAAHQETAVLFEELQDASRHLLICMPTGLKGLVDVMMYLEKHFSILPREVCGHSLALHLLRKRPALRAVARYGKQGPAAAAISAPSAMQPLQAS